MKRVKFALERRRRVFLRRLENGISRETIGNGFPGVRADPRSLEGVGVGRKRTLFPRGKTIFLVRRGVNLNRRDVRCILSCTPSTDYIISYIFRIILKSAAPMFGGTYFWIFDLPAVPMGDRPDIVNISHTVTVPHAIMLYG